MERFHVIYNMGGSCSGDGVTSESDFPLIFLPKPSVQQKEKVSNTFGIDQWVICIFVRRMQK